MARSDLLLSLVRAGSLGDATLFKKVVEALVAEERAKQHHALADQLLANLNESERQTRVVYPLKRVDPELSKAVAESIPARSLSDLVLPKLVRDACLEIVEEHTRRDLLRSYGLEPRHKIILIGPPGNGKTSLAEAIAESLAVPFLSVRYELVIDSYLGSTALKLSELFDYVRTRACVLFFDEFDTLGKERGDPRETGEIKRVVSSLLLQIDSLPTHVIVVTATNHPELLDRAVWRRFPTKLNLPPPTSKDVQEWCSKFEKRAGVKLGASTDLIAKKFENTSFSDLEQFLLDVQRRFVLAGPQRGNLSRLVASRLRLWNRIK